MTNIEAFFETDGGFPRRRLSWGFKSSQELKYSRIGYFEKKNGSQAYSLPSITAPTRHLASLYEKNNCASKILIQIERDDKWAL
jgi:hypothetical protein